LLGTLGNGTQFRLPVEYFAFHFAFYGVTGSGKTRLAMRLAREAEHLGIKLLVIDIEGEWKNVLPTLTGQTEYYSVGSNLKINPLDLDDFGLTKALLRSTVFEGIERDFQDLSPQMNYVLDRTIQKSRSIPELIQNLTEYESEGLPFKLSNLNKTKTALLVRLEPYRTNPALSEIFYCTQSSIDTSNLGSRNVIIDLHELEAKVAYKRELRLAYNTIAISYLREALSRKPTDKTIHMFVAEEAQHLSPKILRKTVVTDTWPSTDYAVRLRKRGECFICVSQSPGTIEDDVRRNAQNVFVFRLQSAEDVQLVARSLGYSWYTALDYLTHTISNLKQRQVLVKTPLIDEPFIIEATDFSPETISPRKLREYMPKVAINFNSMELEFLESIRIEPFISMTERRGKLAWDKGTYTAVVRNLRDRGPIEQISVPLGRSRPLVLYQLKGRNPSIKHEFYVHWIIQQLANKGFVCRAEKVGPDIQIPALNAAINVELGKSSLEQNVATALSRFDTVVIVSDSKRVLDRIVIPRLQEGKKVLKSLIWDVPSLF
jgi:DNA-binding MarR family transcriptional regulator